jgi:hypothetical protein
MRRGLLGSYDTLMSNLRLFLVALCSLLAFSLLERLLRQHLLQVPAPRKGS